MHNAMVPRWSRFAVAASIAAAGILSVSSARGQGCLAGTAGDEFVAEQAGLIREWVLQLPFDSAAWRLERVSVADGLVVGLSGDGVVSAVTTASGTESGAPRPGTLLWSRRVGTPGGPRTAAGIGPDLVTVARDDELYALERSRGTIRWQETLGRLPDAPAVQIGDWVYAPLAGGGIRRVAANPRQATVARAAVAPAPKRSAKQGARGRKAKEAPVAPRPVSADSLVPRTFDGGGRLAGRPQPFGDGVLWHTVDGLIVVLVPTDLGWERHEFPLQSPAVDAPLVEEKAAFAATAAGILVRVDFVDSGNTRLRATWQTSLPAIPDGGPFRSGDTLVVSLGELGLAAFSAETGEPLWRSCVAGRLLAAGGDTFWMIDRVGRLAAIDRGTGELRGTLCLGGFDVPVVNRSTNRLLLASQRGLLVSLAPREPVTDGGGGDDAPKGDGVAGRERVAAPPPVAEPADAP